MARMKRYYEVPCGACGGYGMVSDYGYFGMDFYGANEAILRGALWGLWRVWNGFGLRLFRDGLLWGEGVFVLWRSGILCCLL